MGSSGKKKGATRTKKKSLDQERTSGPNATVQQAHGTFSFFSSKNLMHDVPWLNIPKCCAELFLPCTCPLNIKIQQNFKSKNEFKNNYSEEGIE